MPTLSCLNAFLTPFPIFQAKHYHQSTAHTSVPTILERCHKKLLPVSVGWNLFVPYKTKIYNNSQSVSTNSSSPSTYFMHHHHLCQSEMKRVDSPLICCVQSKSASSMLASLSVCGHMCVWGCVCKLSCVSVLRQCQHMPCIMKEWRAVSLLPHTGQRMQLQAGCSFTSSTTSKTWSKSCTSSSPVSFPRPSGKLITVLGLQLCLHLCVP